jgi:hypothetical protein
VGFPPSEETEENIGGFVGGELGDLVGGDSVVSNSTFSDNVAGSQGGAVAYLDIQNVLGGPDGCGEEQGAGLTTGEEPCERPEGAKLTLLDSTLADNATHADNGIISLYPYFGPRGGSLYAAGGLDIGNSVIADGTSRGAADNCAEDFAPWIQSLGNNVESGDSCFFEEDQNDKINAEPKLGSLRDNGGPTRTRALRPGSAAINSYDGESCGDVDQRGGARPPENGSAGDKCDAGAYEANSLADLSVDSHTDAPDPVTAGSPLTYSIVARNAGPDAINGVRVDHRGDTHELGTLAVGESRTIEVVVRPTEAGDLTSTATVSAAGMTDNNGANDSKSTTTRVEAAGQQLPPQQQPQQGDTDVNVNLTAPGSITVSQFMNGFIVSAYCSDEDCVRRFREHAAINTGATRIAGFNLTVSRTHIPMGSMKKRVRLRPCVSGSKSGKPHKRCLKNLRKAVKKAGKFKVKVVVTGTDAAGNTRATKKVITVRP